MSLILYFLINNEKKKKDKKKTQIMFTSQVTTSCVKRVYRNQLRSQWSEWNKDEVGVLTSVYSTLYTISDGTVRLMLYEGGQIPFKYFFFIIWFRNKNYHKHATILFNLVKKVLFLLDNKGEGWNKFVVYFILCHIYKRIFTIIKQEKK